MPIPVPNLDDRRFQDIVDEAKRLIPRLCPNWTDHNVSDPGITLVELFAWMTEQCIFRLNQVPDKNKVVFLNLLGAGLAPAQPAKGDATFVLSAAPTPERRMIIPAWTEVATERTETEEAIVFTTDTQAEVLSPTPLWVLSSMGDDAYEEHSAAIAAPAPFAVWGDPPAYPQAFLVGFDEDLSAHRIVLQVACDSGRDQVGIGIETARPPWQWHVWRGDELGWQALSVHADTTGGLTETGEITMDLPYRCQPLRLLRRDAKTWLRCTPLQELPPGRAPYVHPPVIRRVGAFSIGITVPVTHALPVGPENLGISDGQPGQTFTLLHQDVLELAGPQECVEVSTAEGGWETWHRVPDFGGASSADRWHTFDPVAGQVAFGPAVRQRDGTEPQFGAIPPVGESIRMRRYRIGGGVEGNVAPDRVHVLKSAIPYVASVINQAPITGGLQAQTLEDAVLRAPALLRTRHRAVTASDYEYLAGQVEGVGRVRCLQPSPTDHDTVPPGSVRLLVIPELAPLVGAELERQVSLHESIAQASLDRRYEIEETLVDQWRLNGATEVRLRDYLNERRLLTTQLYIQQPDYVWVTIQARIKVQLKAEPERVRRQVKVALYRFLDPLVGGPANEGWPFGLPLTIDKVYALIQSIPGVDYATELNLHPIDMTDERGQRLGSKTEVIPVPTNGVIASYYHNVYLS